ncbi:g5508 [Coccomyxa elongata]
MAKQRMLSAWASGPSQGWVERAHSVDRVPIQGLQMVRFHSCSAGGIKLQARIKLTDLASDVAVRLLIFVKWLCRGLVWVFEGQFAPLISHTGTWHLLATCTT